MDAFDSPFPNDPLYKLRKAYISNQKDVTRDLTSDREAVRMSRFVENPLVTINVSPENCEYTYGAEGVRIRIGEKVEIIGVFTIIGKVECTRGEIDVAYINGKR